jgi:hypothetical protein
MKSGLNPLSKTVISIKLTTSPFRARVLTYSHPQYNESVLQGNCVYIYSFLKYNSADTPHVNT